MFEILLEGVKVSVPIMFAAFGGLLTELAGVLNIALEGQILIAALFSAFFSNLTHSLFLGLLGGILSSVLLSFVFVVFSIGKGANIFLVGLGINLLATSLSRFFSHMMIGKQGTWVFKNIPVFSDFWFYISLFVFPVLYIILYYTWFGFYLRVSGRYERILALSGVSPGFYKVSAIILSGIFCGISGFFISVPLSVFIQNMSGGRGWLSLVAIFLGGSRVVGVFIASLFIGMVFIFSHLLQVVSGIDPEIAMIFPYIASILFLILYRRR